MKGKKLLLVFVSFVMLVTVAACSSSKADNPARRISATIKAGFPANTQNSKARSAAAVVGTAAEVASITVDVQDGSGAFVVQGVHLANNNGTWSGMINDIPAGEQLTFTGHAFNGSSQEIFTGIATPVLSGTNAQVTLPLAPVSNNTALQFLNITQIGRPARIAASTTAPVSIVVTGNTNETLSYVITPAADGGTFDSISGSVTLNGNLAAIPFVYTAPGAAGTFTHGVEVVDSRGSSVETTFTTQVVSQLASAETLVQFNPVITALKNKMEEDWEGCLSVPGLRGIVPRYTHIRYQGFDEYGAAIDRTVSDFHARVVQHESDHLDGILYPMRMKDLRKLGFTDVLFPGQHIGDD